MMKFHANLSGLIAVIFSPLVHAAYPSELEWTDCAPGTKCGRLTFCQDGCSFGYRSPDAPDAPCGSFPGPLLRLQRGTTYKLMLHNAAREETNVHAHGLHIVGDGDGDDVTRVVGPGMCLDYTWDIAEDHPSGTYWYHPHFHGSTRRHVAGGAFGMIVVDDRADEVNEWALPENELLLTVMSARSGERDGWRRTVRANGKSQEKFGILPDRWYRLRVAAVDPSAASDVLAFDPGCVAYKVASDGAWNSAGLAAYPGARFVLTGASRADFAVRCDAGSRAISWGGSVVAVLDVDPARASSGGGVAASGNDEADLGAAPPRPYSLEDLTVLAVPESNRFTLGMEKDSIRYEGVEYSKMSGMGTLWYDDVYEVRIRDSARHPFHLHLYHMQVLSGCGAHVRGEHYDTISAPKDQTCLVRFRTADIGQRMVLHCHELEHEDDGAIDFFDVVNVPEQRRNEVVSPQYVCNSNLSRLEEDGRTLKDEISICESGAAGSISGSKGTSRLALIVVAFALSF